MKIIKFFVFQSESSQAESAKIVINKYSSRFPNAYFSNNTGLTSSIKFAISSFLLVGNYDKKIIHCFPSVGILIVSKCQKMLLILTYLDFQIYNFPKLFVSLLL